MKLFSVCFTLLTYINYCLCYLTYDDFAVIKVLPKSKTDLSSLQSLREKHQRLDFWSDPQTFLHPVLFHVSPRLKRNIVSDLNEAKLNFSIVTHNLGEWIREDYGYALRSMRQKVNFDSIDFQRYYPYEKIVDILKSFQDKHPSIVKYLSIGETFERRNIPAIVIDTDANRTKPAILFECGIHAREWISPATCLWIANDLLTTNMGKKLLDEHSFHFIIVTNPDGYKHTWTMNRMWRKNRSPGAFNLWYDCSGVDLNRNFDVEFAAVGSSRDQCTEDYHGHKAFSELETQSVRNYVTELAKKSSIDIYFSMHSFTQVWMYPFSYSFKKPENDGEYQRLSKLAVKAIKDTHGETYRFGNIASVMYRVSGTSVDWTNRNNLSKYSFAIELRDMGEYGFRLPPQLIEPTATEVWNGIKAVINNM